MQALTSVPDDVAGDGHSGHRPQLVTVDDRHAFEVEVALAHAEGLADANAGAEHERHEVREVAPARAGLGSRLVLILRRPLHPR